MTVAAHKRYGRYSRWARILKDAWRAVFAPRVEDYDAEEMAVRAGRPLSNATDYTKRASTASTVSPMTQRSSNSDA